MTLLYTMCTNYSRNEPYQLSRHGTPRRSSAGHARDGATREGRWRRASAPTQAGPACAPSADPNPSKSRVSLYSYLSAHTWRIHGHRLFW
eukprot:6870355-Prymnesium_polylepis.1